MNQLWCAAVAVLLDEAVVRSTHGTCADNWITVKTMGALLESEASKSGVVTVSFGSPLIPYVLWR